MIGKRNKTAAVWSLIGLALVSGILTLTGPVWGFHYLPCIAWPLSAIALLLAISTFTRLRRNTAPTENPELTSRARMMVGFGVATMVFQTYLLGAVYHALREETKVIVSESNLRGIEITLRYYCDKYADYPPTLLSLIETGDCMRKQLVAPNDPGLPANCYHGPETYQSYCYRPGKGSWRNDPEVLVAYEKGAWSPAWLWSARGQLALFADGQVRLLDKDGLAGAMRRDAHRRAELGW